MIDWDAAGPMLLNGTTWVIAPLVVGFVLWQIAELRRDRHERRARRRHIVMLMAEADTKIVRAIVAGIYDQVFQ